MEIVRPGDVVRVRRRTWRVAEVRAYESCRVLTLVGAKGNTGNRCDFISPFDQIDVIGERPGALKRVGIARWRRAARQLIARSGLSGVLQTASGAAIDILPHQLEPAVALLRGGGCRLLLADEVGLGKTIEACLVVSELRARGLADRTLVLTPPGLRDQWRDELLGRFRIDATIADFRTVRQRAGALPSDVNPWSTWPVVVASVDYVKRPEVLRAALNTPWDVIVVDEAHRVANDGDRRRAADALAARAGYVVLLTATPHSGNSAAFDALRNLGSHGDRLLTFRRTRHVLASSVRRRIHRLRVRSTVSERRMFACLDALAAAVRAERGELSRDVWIGLALLYKRAYSSAQALYLSVTRRLDSLAGAPASSAQLLLPLDDFGESSEDDAPEWRSALRLADAERERRVLTTLANAAERASHRESKLQAITRLVRRTREPLIVFTEYRDTLAWLARHVPEPALQLHGGLTRAERLASIAAFNAGRARLLLATDAAGEGLNLQHTCRTVINLELPWNPMRLEQRIGRVDRIGQRRPVHVFHMIGADTGETRVLDELRLRISRAQAEAGAPDPLANDIETPVDAPRSDQADVTTELTRIRVARALRPMDNESTRPLVATTRNRTTRSRLAGRRLSLWECLLDDEQGNTVSSHVIAVSHTAGAEPALHEQANAVLLESAEAARAFARAGLRRTEAIVAGVKADRGSPHQPGLFDRQSPFAQAALAADDADILASLEARADRLRRCAAVRVSLARRLVLDAS